MHIYMAGCYGYGILSKTREGSVYNKLDAREKQGVDSCSHFLESYHYCKSQKVTDLMREQGVPVFLDSGAFSAYTLGATLTVAEYCEYIHRNKDIIKVEDGIMLASVLDGIGDPLQTWRNQQEMELRGVRPLPCFHANEDGRFLDFYIQNYEYITLGGMVGSSTKGLIKWLDGIWNDYLVDGSGRAKLKVHGFGITSIEIMERYPWHSCDSSTWVQAASFGEIILHPHGRIIVSEKSASIHTEGKHILNLSPAEKEYALSLISKQGFNYENLVFYLPYHRAAYNINSLMTIGDEINANHSFSFKSPTVELF